MWQPEFPLASRRSGVPLPGANCLQLVSGNSRVLDTLDAKLQVRASYKSINLLRAVEQLMGGARHSQLFHKIVDLEVDLGFLMTSRSIL